MILINYNIVDFSNLLAVRSREHVVQNRYLALSTR